MTFYLFWCFNFLSIMLQFLVCRNCAYCVKFVAKYFILFYVTLNGVIFLISFWKLRIHRNRLDQEVDLIHMYLSNSSWSAILQPFWIFTVSSFADALGFSMCKSCHLQIVLLHFQSGCLSFCFWILIKSIYLL